MAHHDRLIAARRSAGYETAVEAARAMGIAITTYAGHENGSRGMKHHAERYARFFRVDLAWLLTGKGEMRGRSAARMAVPVLGIVQAGAETTTGEDALPQTIPLPDPNNLGALIVEGLSQFPRFMPGEILLIDQTAQNPEDLIDQIALVQLTDGRRLLKTLRAGTSPGRYTLESINAPPMKNLDILSAWRFCGLLPAGQP